MEPRDRPTEYQACPECGSILAVEHDKEVGMRKWMPESTPKRELDTTQLIQRIEESERAAENYRRAFEQSELRLQQHKELGRL